MEPVFDKNLRNEVMKLEKQLIELRQKRDKTEKELQESCNHAVVVGEENWNAGAPHRICLACGLEDRCYGGWSLYKILDNHPDREVRKVNDIYKYRKLQPLKTSISLL